MEDRLPSPPASKLRQIAAVVDFNLSQRKIIVSVVLTLEVNLYLLYAKKGGHTFPRRLKSPRKTKVWTISFDPAKTKTILKNCKARGVSISSALFAIFNIAWARCTQDWTTPM